MTTDTTRACPRLPRSMPLAGLLVVLAAAGCRAAPLERDLEIARTYRAHVAAGRTERARAMLADGARTWFGDRTGEGRPLDPAPRTGPWAAWDEFFGSTAEVVDPSAAPGSATLVTLETNDYYRLLERGPQRNSLTYFVDAQGRITGLRIASAGPRPMGRTEQFLAWARAKAPDEIAELMPNGEIDPRGDHPRRFRSLLERWRAESGLPAIE